ncbi:MAG: molybdopterin-dependent oxidoreductase, partial [Lutispora sp.]
LDKEIDTIKELGVEIQYEKTFGVDVTYESLRNDGYKAIFLGIGSQIGQPIGCEGEACPMGVYAGVDFLGRVGLGHNIDLSGKHVIVIGGGNTAIDASRTALRLGAKKVTVAYRRTKKEMPAHEMEIDEAEYEGVEFEFLIAPKQIVSDSGKPIYIEFIRMKLGEPDASGRRRPIEIPGSEFKMPADYVIGAIGQTQDLSFINDNFKLEVNKNKIVVDPDIMTTNLEGVFAGGDGVTGPQTAIKAIAAGRTAAYSMDKYLRGAKIEKLPGMYNHVKGKKLKDIEKKEYEEHEKIEKIKMPMLNKEERNHNFKEVELGFTEEQAKAEAARCLSCGSKDVHECKLREFATTYDAKQDRLAGAITKHPIDESHPFISRDRNKCIMCGRCVRICLEVQGAGALGFISRGYNATIEPSFSKPFGEDSRCESCGQCVSACPVGALTEKVQLPKPGPFAEQAMETTCNHCGTGCTLKLHVSGDRFIRATSEVGLGINNGNLCENGRFKNSFINSSDRLIKPMIRKDGKLVESTWEEAYKLMSEKMKAYRAMGFVSQKATSEEVAEMKKLVSGKLYSFELSDADYGLQDAFGKNYKKASYESIDKADLILCLGFDIKEKNPVAALMVKAAAENSTELVMVSETVSKLDRYAGMVIRVDDNKVKDFAETLIKAAKGEAGNGIAVAMAEKLKAASNPLIVIGGAAGYAEAKAAAELVKALGKNEESILLMQNKSNSLGLIGLGVKSFKAAELSLKDNAVLVYGEDPIGTGNPEAEKALKEAGFIVVYDMLLTETAKLADVILPMTSFAENEGTYTNSEGRVQKVNKAMEPKTGKSNLDVLKSL